MGKNFALTLSMAEASAAGAGQEAFARPCFTGERGLTPINVFANMSAAHFIDPTFTVKVWGFERFQVSGAWHDARSTCASGCLSGFRVNKFVYQRRKELQ